MGPFIAYCITDFETLLGCLIFGQFFSLPSIAPNINTDQIKVFKFTECRDKLRLGRLV